MSTELETALGANSNSMSVENNDAFSNLLSSIPTSLQSTQVGEGESTTNDNKPTGEEGKPEGQEGKTEEVKTTETEVPKVTETTIETVDTKTETTTEENEESFIALAKAELGLEDDEDEDEETVEGIINVGKKAIAKAVAKAKEAGPTALYEKHPIVKGLVEHIETGGSILTFQQRQQIQDFSKVEIKADDIETQEQFYRASLEARGMEEDEIEETITTAKDKGVLLDRANKGKEYIVKINNEKIQAQINSEKAEHQKQVEANKKAEEEVRSILTSGKIMGTPITKEEADELEKWSLIPDDKGQTQRDVAWGKLTTEQWLLLDKIVKNDFKGLGVKIKPTTSKPLSELKPKTKTVNMQTSSGGNTISSQLALSSVKDLFNRE